MKRMLALICTAYAAGCSGIVTGAEPTLDQLPRGSVMTLTPSAKSAPVNGAVELLATLPSGANSRIVTFTVSGKGLFIDAGAASVVEIAVADSLDSTKLLARTTLRDTLAETVFIRAIIGPANAPIFFDTVSVTFRNP